MQVMEIITVLAIIIGPISAVIITRKMGEYRETRERKLDIFRSLMRTRNTRVSQDHVNALNLIEMEFYKSIAIGSNYRAYLDHLRSPMPATDQQESYYSKRNALFVELLKTIGAELGYQFDKHDLDRHAYAPVGWEQDGNVQRRNAHLITEVLEGRRPLPVTSLQIPDNSPFPPPPEIEDGGQS